MTSTLPQTAAVTGDGWRDGRVLLPHLDLVVGQACELRCVGCTNGMGMLEHLPMFPLADLVRDIRDATRAMVARKVCILGGEALLHRRLVAIMLAVRELGLGDVVQVLTNGLALHRMGEEFWTNLDWLKISVYPGRTPEANIALARERSAEHGFALDFYDVAADPFRAVHTREAKNQEAAQAAYDRCWYRQYTRKIEAGYFWRCCTSPSISRVILGQDPKVDGLALNGLTSEALVAFLDQPQAMSACTRCHGHAGPRLSGWSEERDRTRWLAASAR